MKKYLPLLILISISVLAYTFGLHKYLTLDALKANADRLDLFVKENLLLALFSYFIAYMVIIALSIPVATFMTLLGGFLFHQWMGTLTVVFAATIGASLIFYTVKKASGGFTERMGPWVQKMEKGFKENAFYYMLTLRLVPLFPFVIVNIVPALLQVPFRTYFWGTLLGIIPGSFVYVGLGQSLRLAVNNPSFSVALEPQFIWAFVGLGLLSLLPIAYKYFKKNH